MTDQIGDFLLYKNELFQIRNWYDLKPNKSIYSELEKGNFVFQSTANISNCIFVYKLDNSKLVIGDIFANLEHPVELNNKKPIKNMVKQKIWKQLRRTNTFDISDFKKQDEFKDSPFLLNQWSWNLNYFYKDLNILINYNGEIKLT